MRTARLTRSRSTDAGTFGILRSDKGNSYHTGELPWRGNQSNVSCVPAGVYAVKAFTSPKHGDCYQLCGVPGRTAVEIHRGNWCGDRAKGYYSDVLGCIILGTDAGELERPDGKGPQEAVLHSTLALKLFMADMGRDGFELTIEDAP